MFYDEPSYEPFYDTALVCQNGHTINDSSRSSPQFNKSFCDRCGEPTINSCPACKKPIRGDYKTPNVMVIGVGPGLAEPPAFCAECGKPYPWTERRLAAAREITDLLEDLSDDDKEKLKGSLDDLIREGPRTEPAKLRFKGIMKKVGRESYETVKSVMTDLVSETVRKALFGG